jgi:hypothetical protein
MNINTEFQFSILTFNTWVLKNSCVNIQSQIVKCVSKMERYLGGNKVLQLNAWFVLLFQTA